MESYALPLSAYPGAVFILIVARFLTCMPLGLSDGCRALEDPQRDQQDGCPPHLLKPMLPPPVRAGSSESTAGLTDALAR
jgi:hypothetical protein